MARDEKKLKEMFLADARKTADLLRAGRSRLRGGKAGADELDAAFRAVHSIKSEAAFLGLGELADAAGRVEAALSRARGGAAEAPGFTNSIERLEGLLAGLVKENESRADIRPAGAAELGEFEKNQLRESVLRGERLFKVSCSVDLQNPMPYARLYLVVNNLEVSANVIHMDPPLEELADGKSRALELLVSSGLSQEKLKRLVSVDQLEKLVVEPMTIRDFFPEEAGAEGGPAGQAPYRSLAVEYPSSVAISRTTAQEALLLAELGARLPAGSDEAWRALLDGQARVWSEAAGVSTAWLVQKLEGVMADLNGRSGKAVRLACSGELKARLPFDTFGGLADALVQLVRNAHDHGIESAEERRLAGKRLPGRIGVHFAVKDGRWRVSVRDDGRGIDRAAVLERARSAGMKPAENADLLELIAAPGFSMASGGSAVSGRGVGLDIARYAALTVLGGSISLETAPGAGSAFFLEFDPAASRRRVIPILVGSLRLPVPDFMLREYAAWNVERLKEDKGGLCYQLREMLVPIHPDFVADIPSARFAAIIQRRGEIIAVPAMEILKETYLGRDEIIDSPLRGILAL